MICECIRMRKRKIINLNRIILASCELCGNVFNTPDQLIHHTGGHSKVHAI